MRVFLITLGVIIFIIALGIYLHHSDRSGASKSPYTVTPSSRNGSPPPLPERLQTQSFTIAPEALRNPLDFPRCPKDRRRNEPGKPQLIFWDAQHKCYTCGNGHRFTGRE